MNPKPLSKSVFQLAKSLLAEDGTPVKGISSKALRNSCGLQSRTYYWAASELVAAGVLIQRPGWFIVANPNHYVFTAVRSGVSS